MITITFLKSCTLSRISSARFTLYIHNCFYSELLKKKFSRVRNLKKLYLEIFKYHIEKKRVEYFRSKMEKIVYYVPRRTMRVIAWRATMLAGEWSQGVIEAQVRRNRGVAETKPRRDQSCEHYRESRNFPNVCIGTYSVLCDFGAYTSFYAYTRI